LNQKEIVSFLRSNSSRWQEAFDVESLAIFGSFAQGNSGPDSDLDILVSFRHDPTFDRFMGLKYAIEDALGLTVDLVTEEALRPQWREKILQECQRVA
jgi:hypothetical protein